jgi:hypothetical protein
MSQKQSINSSHLHESDLAAALIDYGGENAKTVATNPKLLKATFDLLRATHSGSSLAGAAATLSATSAGAKAMHAAPQTLNAARSASFAVSTFKTTMDMANVFKLTHPGAVLAYLGAATVQKTGLAVSLAGGDNEKAKCVGALMELAGSSAAAIALAPVTAPTGILLALTMASLTAQAIHASQACSAM